MKKQSKKTRQRSKKPKSRKKRSGGAKRGSFTVGDALAALGQAGATEETKAESEAGEGGAPLQDSNGDPVESGVSADEEAKPGDGVASDTP